MAVFAVPVGKQQDLWHSVWHNLSSFYCDKYAFKEVASPCLVAIKYLWKKDLSSIPRTNKFTRVRSIEQGHKENSCR